MERSVSQDTHDERQDLKEVAEHSLNIIMDLDFTGKETEVVLVFYEDHSELLGGQAFPIVAFVATPEKIGSTINTVTQLRTLGGVTRAPKRGRERITSNARRRSSLALPSLPKEMHPLAETLHKHNVERVVCISQAKVRIGIVWDPESELACDMNVNNVAALEDTRRIRSASIMIGGRSQGF